MLAGLVLLAFMSRRQISIFVLICGFIFAKLIVALIDKYDKEGTEQSINAITSIFGKIVTILLGILVSFTIYREKINNPHFRFRGFFLSEGMNAGEGIKKPPWFRRRFFL